MLENLVALLMIGMKNLECIADTKLIMGHFVRSIILMLKSPQTTMSLLFFITSLLIIFSNSSVKNLGCRSCEGESQQ